MTALVVGDVMLDLFEEGVVDRISPEAPVPVLHNPSGHDVLGGAANTARGVHALGLHAALLGLVGDDLAGRRCHVLATEAGISSHLIPTANWRTTVKHRFMAGGQQILRVDTEDPLPTGASGDLGARVPELFAGTSVVVLSDYGKGVVSDDVARDAIRLAIEASVPVIVDTKRADPGIFKGSTVLAPNHMEATRMTGKKDPALAAEAIAARTGAAVVVTLGPGGMLVFDNGHAELIQSVAVEVADVTGAGDSVTAALAVALVEGATLVEAGKFASAVAAIAVAHSGTYAVKRTDLA